jgi:single-stranded-DNA-specific exonuclease
MTRTRHITRREHTDAADSALPDELHPVLRRVYESRGVNSATLDLSLGNLLPVSRLDAADDAAERLLVAREAQEAVLILGDFDVDGATATAVMMTCLDAFGFSNISFMVPDRQRYGYGLSPGIVELAAERKPGLIVTVDNGISSHAGVAAAREYGIDVLITDHHLQGDSVPDAAVIVNPNSHGNSFPSKSLAGVGVAFYVMAALGQRLGAEGWIDSAEARSIVASCLDLVALGTVADLVPLDYNNRVLVAQGMARIRANRSRPGINALFQVAERSMADAVTSDLAFAIGPRLNAAGRLTDMTVGINCLLAPDESSALPLARELTRLNTRRRELQAEMQETADLHLDDIEDQLGDRISQGVCLYDSNWHQGVVGLIATRVRERVNRPVIAFAPGETDEILKGSGRSVQGVHMRDLLAAIDARCPGLIDRYGGHAMAAGLSLQAARFDEFSQAFTAEVELHAGQIDDIEKLWSDGELNAEDISLTLAETLRHAAPWGQAFPEPAFDGQFELVDQRIVGERHLKMRLRPLAGGQLVDGIAFNHGELIPPDKTAAVRLLYRLEVNEFRSARTHQLVVQHIECD